MWSPRGHPSTSSSASLPSIIPFLFFLVLLTLPDSGCSSSSSYFQHLLASIPDSQLDANRSVLVGDERFFIPRRIPKLSRAQKRRLLAEQFARDGAVPPREFYETDWGGGESGGGGKRRRHKKRRAGTQPAERPWQQQPQQPATRYVVRRQYRPRINIHLQARNTGPCPEKLDAVTEGFNRHLYMFAGDMVYEVWRDHQGLQQRQAFALRDLFPDGPRLVTAAVTNQKSGVTVLLEYRTAYRFRWDKRHQRFYMARNSPQQLPTNVDFMPRVGFQWKDGHLILANNQKFVSYDAFWNLASFSSDKAKEYFPNMDNTLVGVARQGRDTYLMATEDGKLQVYDMLKYRVELEFPLSLRHILACLVSPPSNTTSAPDS